MSEPAKINDPDPAARTQVQKEMDALLERKEPPPTNAEILDILARMPPRVPHGWTSAELIRELRGPLPEDDPEFANVDRR